MLRKSLGLFSTTLLTTVYARSTIEIVDPQVKVYEPADFDGLFTYLMEDECDGPKLMTCDVGDKDTTDIDTYFLNIDDCLYSHDCLSYHQILSLKQKLNLNSLVM